MIKVITLVGVKCCGRIEFITLNMLKPMRL